MTQSPDPQAGSSRSRPGPCGGRDCTACRTHRVQQSATARISPWATAPGLELEHVGTRASRVVRLGSPFFTFRLPEPHGASRPSYSSRQSPRAATRVATVDRRRGSATSAFAPSCRGSRDEHRHLRDPLKGLSDGRPTSRRAHPRRLTAARSPPTSSRTKPSAATCRGAPDRPGDSHDIHPFVHVPRPTPSDAQRS